MFTDDFTGAAGAALSGRPGWTLALGAERFQISAGGARLSGTTGSSSSPSYYYSPDPGSADQFVEANVKPTGNGYVIATRMDAGGRRGYGVQIDAAGDAVLRRYDNNVVTALATIADAISIADVVRLESSGSTHRVYRNGVQIGGDIVDAVIAAGRCGIIHRSVNASADHYDNFASGALAGAAALAPASAALPHGAGAPALSMRAGVAAISARLPHTAGAARLTLPGAIAAAAERTLRVCGGERVMRVGRP